MIFIYVTNIIVSIWCQHNYSMSIFTKLYKHEMNTNYLPTYIHIINYVTQNFNYNKTLSITVHHNLQIK